MEVANELIGMVKYVAERSRNKYVVGRKEWKTMIVSKLMNLCRTLEWYQHECEDLEVKQTVFADGDGNCMS